MRLRFRGVHDIRELHGIVYEEDWYRIAHDIPVPFVCVELDGETTHIANCVRRAAGAEHGAEAEEHRGCAGCVGQDASRRVLLKALVQRELAEGASATGVDDTLGDPLMVESVDFLASGVVLQELWAGLVFGGNLEPVVWAVKGQNMDKSIYGGWRGYCPRIVLTCVTLLDAIVRGNPRRLIEHVFGVLGEVGDFAIGLTTLLCVLRGRKNRFLDVFQA